MLNAEVPVQITLHLNGNFSICGYADLSFSVNRNFDDAIFTVFKYIVCRFYFVESEAMGYKRCGVNLALLD